MDTAIMLFPLSVPNPLDDVGLKGRHGSTQSHDPGHIKVVGIGPGRVSTLGMKFDLNTMLVDGYCAKPPPCYGQKS